jgi:hypothetical protein
MVRNCAVAVLSAVRCGEDRCSAFAARRSLSLMLLVLKESEREERREQ